MKTKKKTVRRTRTTNSDLVIINVDTELWQDTDGFSTEKVCSIDAGAIGFVVSHGYEDVNREFMLYIVCHMGIGWVYKGYTRGLAEP